MAGKSGGKYVSSGTYGCVFTPPVECINKTSHGHGYVGKVFTNQESYKEEVDIMDIVKDIDPNQSFTIHYTDACEIAKPKRKDLLYSPGKTPRDVCMRLSSGLMQIVYPHGGVDMFSYSRQNSVEALGGNYTKAYGAFVKWFASLGPVLKGIETMGERGIVHMDIKPPNMLFDDVHFQTKLIDFGLMRKFTTMYDGPDSLIASKYMFFPPEFVCHYYFASIVDSHSQFTLPSTSAILSHVFGSMRSHFKSPLSTFKGLGIDPKAELATMIDSFHAVFGPTIAKNPSDIGQAISSMFKPWLEKADVWAMGVSVLDIINAMGLLPIKEHDKKAQPLPVKKRMPISVEIRMRLVCELIAGMVHVNPNLRWSIQRTIQRYNEIMPLIRGTAS